MVVENSSVPQKANQATPSDSKMKFKIIPAPETLKNDVECIRLAEYTGEERLAIKVFLNGLPGIVFQHHQGNSPVENITTPSGSNFHIPTLYIYGQMTKPGVMNHKTEPYTLTQVILKPHALRTLFGINASELTNGMVELNEFSGEDLNSQLIEANNEAERITLLTNFLLDRLEQAKARDKLIEESLRLIHKFTGSITVKYLLERLYISERQFERRFIQTVGISPRFYIRVKRFNAAIKMMTTGRHERHTDIAYALNFHDQSHFIRDVKELSGITPKGISHIMGDFYHDQGVYFQVKT